MKVLHTCAHSVDVLCRVHVRLQQQYPILCSGTATPTHLLGGVHRGHDSSSWLGAIFICQQCPPSANQPSSVQTLHRPVWSHRLYRKVPTNTELHRLHRVCTTLYRLISLYRLPKTSRISTTLHYQTLIVVLIQTYITPNSTYSSKYIINYQLHIWCLYYSKTLPDIFLMTTTIKSN